MSGEQAAIAAGHTDHPSALVWRADTDDEVTTVVSATATAIFPASVRTSRDGSGDFVQDIQEAAARIDRRLRHTLTPQQYAMVQDLVLATRITTIAQDALDERAEPSAA